MRRAAIELHVFGRLYWLGLPQGVAKLAVQRIFFQGFKADALLHGRGAEQGFGGYAQLWLLFHHRLSGFGGENALPRHAAALEIGIPHIFQNRHQGRGFGQVLDLNAVQIGLLGQKVERIVNAVHAHVHFQGRVALGIAFGYFHPHPCGLIAAIAAVGEHVKWLAQLTSLRHVGGLRQAFEVFLLCLSRFGMAHAMHTQRDNKAKR